MSFTRHYDELLGHFTRATGDREAARDVVQESHARAWALGPRLDAVLDLRALLFRIGRHLVIDEARRRQAEARALHNLALLCEQDAAPSAERCCAASQQLERLGARLALMPLRRRTAFILVRVHGFSHAEAAAHMGVSVAGIEKHVVRATLDLAPRALLVAAAATPTAAAATAAPIATAPAATARP
ncbi:RNA polymerase sigma factor [Vandammella animalimorsus]|uniref:RNA polymerase sigma factor n=1 Tax=Vandammella animalimorsus TaxID=2029117 RepID=A0A3M6R9Y0_9BURK|nr:RNA polymerase sigma factor [Vandammella animalimorsus]RMX11828.1 RNA polymerase sigma factor [Vandammella animalimorsus]